MQYTKLGATGLDVSRICCGCMGFGIQSPEFPVQWLLPEREATEVVKAALDLGINYFDTANAYALGTCEEILGRALKANARRDEIVIQTKYYMPMGKGPNSRGCSRKHIMSQVEQSLKRLGTDYIDVYVMHRWDYETPIEETMSTLNDLVRQGKVRYIGASAMYAWQFQKARNVAKEHGWETFVSMQNHLNLLYREEEREMLPYCRDAGVACTPYSPLASGRLTRPVGEESSVRAKTDNNQKRKYDATLELDAPIIERVQEIAEKRGIAMAQVALAWLLQKKPVAAVLVGATKASHLVSAAQALDVSLTEDEIRYLEEPYLPHPIVGAY